jgi:predicted RNase H-like HicB family nuclease
MEMPMRCSVHLRHEAGEVVARCPEFPDCLGRGPTREAALERLRASVTFWLEACPCDQTAAPGLTLEVVQDTR